MSILLESENGWIISHSKYFENIKVKVEKCNSGDDDCVQLFKLNPDLFEITEPFRPEANSKGPSGTISESTDTVKRLSETILRDPMARGVFEEAGRTGGEESRPCCLGGDGGNNAVPIDHDESDLKKMKKKLSKNNFEAVKAAHEFFDKVKDIKWPEFHGQNPFPDVSVISEVESITCRDDKCHKFIFPPGCKFYCKDVYEGMDKVLGLGDKDMFDLVIMDPPWRNKFIRRKKRKQEEAGYQLINDEGIAKLPVKTILKEGGVLAVWCTNAKSHREALVNEIFPKWGVSYHETWYWLKVTKSGVPICPFNEDGKKQPYEAIIFGIMENKVGVSGLNCKIENEICHKVIISTPSSINSHKPPLTDVIKRRFKEKQLDRKCEIFARYLVPGFTSIGNEVIKLQHLSNFVLQN